MIDNPEILKDLILPLNDIVLFFAIGASLALLAGIILIVLDEKDST